MLFKKVKVLTKHLWKELAFGSELVQNKLLISLIFSHHLKLFTIFDEAGSCSNPLHLSLWLHLLCLMHQKKKPKQSPRPKCKQRQEKNIQLSGYINCLNRWKSASQELVPRKSWENKDTLPKATKFYIFEMSYLILRTIEFSFSAKAWTSDQQLRAQTSFQQVDQPCMEA